ncbi:uncharacterized protein MYCGRDRAFT_78133, partial [Zymoseptoria tritici IPO323]
MKEPVVETAEEPVEAESISTPAETPAEVANAACDEAKEGEDEPPNTDPADDHDTSGDGGSQAEEATQPLDADSKDSTADDSGDHTQHQDSEDKPDASAVPEVAKESEESPPDSAIDLSADAAWEDKEVEGESTHQSEEQSDEAAS